MKFLVDESVSWRFARALREAGHDSVHVDQIGLSSSPDPAVFQAAIDGLMHIITQDIDFETLLLGSGRDVPSVVLLRLSNGRATAQAAAFLENLETFKPDLESGAIVVIEDERIRIHRTGSGDDL